MYSVAVFTQALRSAWPGHLMDMLRSVSSTSARKSPGVSPDVFHSLVKGDYSPVTVRTVVAVRD